MTIAELEKLIVDAANVYYTGKLPEDPVGTHREPILTDTQFDTYVRYLNRLNPNSKVLSKTGWGYDPKIASGEKVIHRHGGMDSIANKPRSVSEIPITLRYNVRISAKLDGLSSVVHFDRGQVVRCVTRGDGTTGLDKTEHFKAICDRVGYPQLPEDFTGEVRGELVISQQNWQQMKAEGCDLKNSRNAAAGIINSKTVPDTIKYVDWIPYKVIWDQTEALGPQVLSGVADNCLCNYFSTFPGLPSYYVVGQSYTESILEECYIGWNAMWPCDGVVITDMHPTRSDSGCWNYTEVAFKFDALKRESVVTSIDWQMSKQSVLIPVANIQPVEIGGSTISRVTLHNAKLVREGNITVGTHVVILKSGDVIPKLEDYWNDSADTKADMPTTCPICGSSLVWKGVNLCCDNSNCGNVDAQSLKVWYQQLAPVSGLGDLLTQKYFEQLSIASIADVYQCSQANIDALDKQGVQAKLVKDRLTILRNDIASLRSALLALNIPRLGEKTAEALCRDAKFTDIMKSIIDSKSFDIVENFTVRNQLFSAISKCVGEATAKSVIQHCDNFNLWGYLSGISVPAQLADVAEKIPVVITGRLSMKRAELVSLLERNGFVVKEDVTKKTRYLISNEVNGTSSKHKKASQLGIEKITEADVLRMV